MDGSLHSEPAYDTQKDVRHHPTRPHEGSLQELVTDSVDDLLYSGLDSEEPGASTSESNIPAAPAQQEAGHGSGLYSSLNLRRASASTRRSLLMKKREVQAVARKQPPVSRRATAKQPTLPRSDRESGLQQQLTRMDHGDLVKLFSDVIHRKQADTQKSQTELIARLQKENSELKKTSAVDSLRCREHRAALSHKDAEISEMTEEVARLHELLEEQKAVVQKLEQDRRLVQEKAETVIEHASTILAGFTRKRTQDVEEAHDDDELKYASVSAKKPRVEGSTSTTISP
ncbi:hypothetical protein CERSUDRAFT_97050 [Gelatoporia subvermispora B]|uniref:Uncharacterized protein n=1 Tax=Ceriporiopsis subvermispora (strain B) TaxID=914234 RepID=M2QDK9_CERS8|nr:hypothetical protein CERSUDRAFT_97050 [Gelatoporia subvermispora B]